MKRSLSIKRETLAELTADELGAVNGGEIRSGLSCPLVDCLNYTFPPRCASGIGCAPGAQA